MRRGPDVRSAAEIGERLAAVVAERKPLDFRMVTLINFAAYDDVIATGAAVQLDRDAWNESRDRSHRAVLAEAVTYLDFAVGKALEHRGLSAIRAVQRLGEYLWLLDADHEGYLRSPFSFYGAPALAAAAERLGVSVPDDPRFARMAAGQPCVDGCPDCRHPEEDEEAPESPGDAGASLPPPSPLG